MGKAVSVNRPLHPVLDQVTQRIINRSEDTRSTYLETVEGAKKPGPYRKTLGCANAAHAYAAMDKSDKILLAAAHQPNLAIVNAYNDMLSAHKPYECYPELIRSTARECGATAQVACGVPAMCDGITQGEDGMELSLFSRDVIALSTAVGLSHNTFDAALMLGICDKIVPGLFIGALHFGHLPVVFVPAGPMTSGLANDKKAKIRQLYAEGSVDRETLLKAEQEAYHGQGTCTFYGTANSNQMLMEIMGLHLPGSSFVNPKTPLREALTREATRRALALAQTGSGGVGHMIDAKVIVNGMVGLLATGGSTNHTLHLVAMARAAGIQISWDDFAELSSVVPLLARVYPNGVADVNHFNAAGGMGFLIAQLLKAGLLHGDVETVFGKGLHEYTKEPTLDGEKLVWKPVPETSGDESVLRPVDRPFAQDGGLRLLAGNLGRAVVKISAVKREHRVVRAQAVVVEDQKELLTLFEQGQLERDFIAVVRGQGPKANGMPELHKLTPVLGLLQDRGFKVALVTDGRMSGASGKVPAAIHLCPEAVAGGVIAKVESGDWITLDCENGTLNLEVSTEQLLSRTPFVFDGEITQRGCGRELFALFRKNVGSAEDGASPLFSKIEHS